VRPISMDSSNILRDTVKENNVYGQMERSTSLENLSGTEIPTVIHELLILQDGKM
jgi:hypothetical protein